MLTLEETYSFVYKNILKAVNPLKKRVIKTECVVHKAIVDDKMELTENDK